MKELIELIRSHGVSRPVFNIGYDSKNKRIIVSADSPAHPYIPKALPGNPLSALVAANYRDNFDMDTQTFHVDEEHMLEQCKTEMHERIKTFLMHNMQTADPSRSKLYRWVNYKFIRIDVTLDVSIMLYKYICSFADTQARTYDTHRDHTNNVIALLTAMMEKHEPRK